MSPILRVLKDFFEARIAEGEQPARCLVAFSGGIDSTVLLHALLHIDLSIPVLAVHIDHRLSDESASWERHCRACAEALGIEYVSRTADIANDSGTGPEAAARTARYGILATLVQQDDWLLCAHHESDQAETVLLNLFRGSGPIGLSAMDASRPFAKGRLVRPLLGVSREQIGDYAKREKLSWIEDPSNLDRRFDRNFLRNEVLPTLGARWPALSARLTRSAELAREATGLLDDLAGIDLESAGTIEKLDIAALEKLTPQRQRNLLRYAIRCLGLPPPPAKRLTQVIDELMRAREDAQPMVRWTGVEVRRYRDRIYLLAADAQAVNANPAGLLRAGSPVTLGSGLGSLCLRASASTGIDPAIVRSGLSIRNRRGGESIRPIGRDHAHKLKKLLQDAGVLPWMRPCVPLLYSGDRLVAVADLWVAAEFSAENGFVVIWKNRPAHLN